MGRRPTLDELKRRRDGHLEYGKRPSSHDPFRPNRVEEVPEESVPRARSSDPSTSKEAADRIYPYVNNLEREVLEALDRLGRGTIVEIAEEAGVDKWSISPRLAPLRRRGLVEEVAKDGRSIVWARTGKEYATR